VTSPGKNAASSLSAMMAELEREVSAFRHRL
jgi:hypothetical protein